MIKRLSYLFCLVFCLTSCDWINPEEPIPSYLIVSEPTFSTNPNEGSAATNITEVWIFLDDEFMGAFPIPATVPILKEGNAALRVEAGIRVDGRSATPDIYPFYMPYRQNINLSAGSEITVQPNFRYRPETKFALIEDFERGTSIFRDIITGTAQSRMRISNEAPFEGGGSGFIQLTDTDAFVEIASAGRYQDLLVNGNSVYLEVHYRSEVPVSFGILGYQQGSTEPSELTYRAGFNPSVEWNKIYFDFTPIIFGSLSDQFKIILQAALPLDENNNFALDRAQVFLDNIKLVHF